MRRRRLLRAVAASLVLAWLLLCAGLVISALDRGRDGRTQLQAARDDIELADLLDGSTVAALDAAADAFEDAGSRLRNPALIPLRPAPVVGRHLASARDLVSAAETASRVLGRAADGAAEAVATSDGTSESRLQLVRTLAAIVHEVAVRLDRLDLGPDDALVPSLADLRAELERRLDEIRRASEDASHALATMADLLGERRRTLVLAANNAEMRAAGGMFLSAGELVSADGEIAVGDFIAVEEANPEVAVEIPAELGSLWGWAEPGLDFRNLLLSPRFPVAARLAADMWAASGRGAVDGVVAVDALALGAIVDVAGPVVVDGETLDGAAVVDDVLRGQYRRFAGHERPARQARADALARAVFERFVDGDWDVVDMAERLRDAVAGRHILGWSRHADVQDGWEAMGADGEVPADGLVVALANRGTTKTDPYVVVEADLLVQRTDDRVDVSVRLQIENRVPDDAPATITSDRPDIALAAGVHRAIVAVSVPRDAADLRFEDQAELNVFGPDGRSQVIGYQVDLPRGARHTTTVSFSLPAASRRLVVLPSAREPAILWRHGAAEWRDHAARAVDV